MGNFPVFPFTGCPNDNVTLCDFRRENRAIPHINGTVEARPGYFALTLTSDIKAEMTVTNRTALYRFTFPKSDSATKAVIMTELNDLPHSASNTRVFHDNSTGRVSGNGSFTPSFGTGNYNLHFCADFKGAVASDMGLFSGNDVWTNAANGTPPENFWPQGAFNRFVLEESRQILVRVGVSFISIEQACGNAERELPDFDFEKTLSAAEEAWKAKLDVIEVDDHGISGELKEVFWSGIYRSFISPQVGFFNLDHNLHSNIMYRTIPAKIHYGRVMSRTTTHTTASGILSEHNIHSSRLWIHIRKPLWFGA